MWIVYRIFERVSKELCDFKNNHLLVKNKQARKNQGLRILTEQVHPSKKPDERLIIQIKSEQQTSLARSVFIKDKYNISDKMYLVLRRELNETIPSLRAIRKYRIQHNEFLKPNLDGSFSNNIDITDKVKFHLTHAFKRDSSITHFRIKLCGDSTNVGRRLSCSM